MLFLDAKLHISSSLGNKIQGLHSSRQKSITERAEVAQIMRAFMCTQGRDCFNVEINLT